MKILKDYIQKNKELINSIERYFLYTEKGSFILSISDNDLLKNEVNTILKENLSLKGKNILFFEWNSDELKDRHPFFILSGFVDKNKGMDGLIINNIDHIIEEFPHFLTQLNFNRETITGYGIPIMFWFQNNSLNLFIEKAFDTFTQRFLPNFYFEDFYNAEKLFFESDLRSYLKIKYEYFIWQFRYFLNSFLHENELYLKSSSKEKNPTKFYLLINIFEYYSLIPLNNIYFNNLINKEIYKFNLFNLSITELSIITEAHTKIGNVNESKEFLLKIFDLASKEINVFKDNYINHKSIPPSLLKLFLDFELIKIKLQKDDDFAFIFKNFSNVGLQSHAIALLYFSFFLYSKKDYKEMEKALLEAFSYNSDTTNKILILNGLGVISHIKGKFYNAEKYYKEALNYCEKNSLVELFIKENLLKFYLFTSNQEQATILQQEINAFYKMMEIELEKTAELLKPLIDIEA